MKLLSFRHSLVLSTLMLFQTVFTQSVAIKCGRIYNPGDGVSLTDKCIIIEGTKITGLCDTNAIPSGSKVIDCSGMTVLPGLVDAHTHLCINFIISYDQSGIDYLGPVVMDPPGYRVLQGAAHAREMLECGFTCVRDAGNSGRYLDVALKRAIKDKLVPGPFIVPAGRIIAPFGGQFSMKADKQFLLNDEYFFADTKDELRKAIRENIYYGSEVIKIVVDGQKYSYSADDIRFIVQEAAGAGLKVMAHCQTEKGAYNSALGGVASIEHGWNLSDSTLLLMKQKGIVLVTTDFTVHSLMSGGASQERAEKTHARFVKRLKQAYQAGIKIAFGTDVQASYHGMNRGEMAREYIDSFIEAEIPAAEILKMCTVNGYELLGLDKQRGKIAPEMTADLIAVEGNQLEDIRKLENVKLVMRDGVVIKGGSAGR